MSKKWPRVDKLVKQFDCFIRQVDREKDWKEAELLAWARCDSGLKSGWRPATGRIPWGQHGGQYYYSWPRQQDRVQPEQVWRKCETVRGDWYTRCLCCRLKASWQAGEWTKEKLMKFSKGICRIQWRINPHPSTEQGLRSSFAEKMLGSPVEQNHWTWAGNTLEPSGKEGCIRKKIASSSREVTHGSSHACHI